MSLTESHKIFVKSLSLLSNQTCFGMRITLHYKKDQRPDQRNEHFQPFAERNNLRIPRPP